MTYLLGTDVSVWQTNDASNPTRFWDARVAKPKGMSFGIVRASIGSAVDKAVAEHVKRFNQAGLPVGCYHYLRSDVSYITQADKYLATVSGLDLQLPHVCDVEHAGVGLDMVRAWCGRVASKTGKPVIIYTSPGFWNGLTGVKTATWALDYDYWVAHYLSVAYPVRGIPDAVYSTPGRPTPLQPWASNGKDWTFWQFCAAGDGEYYGGNYSNTTQSALDMDVYNGDPAKFAAQFGLDAQPPVVDPPTDPPADIPDTALSARVDELEAWARGIGFTG